MSRDAKSTINLPALTHNLNVVKAYAPDSDVLAMIKSNAYGHGMIQLAQHLKQTNVSFGVACLSEAIELRNANIKNDIFVMEGFFDKSEIPLYLQYKLTAVINNEQQIMWLADNQIPHWLKFDTGMHRLGFESDRSDTLVFASERSDRSNLLGLMTHFADADNADKTFTKKQLHKFNKLSDGFSNKKSAANSAAIIDFPESHFDMVRPGIMLYGVSPFVDKTGCDLNLKPVMELSAKLIAIKQIKKGDSVGYGCAYQAENDMTIGIVGIGYGDGYPRHAPNGTPTIINGVICPLVGRVSMDMIAVDLSLYSSAKQGDTVILWGEDCPVEKIAALSGTIAYELLCGISNRVEFVY